jgi:rhodanese-related sulfurtransferase
MRHTAFLLFLQAAPLLGQSPYANDNVRYRTVYLEDLVQVLDEHPDALILDVRSPGEFADTSHWTGLNIGRLKGAVNIPIQELDGRLAEIRAYQDKPVFVYCSHSQRSRRVSTLLADSGFSMVHNVNGGLSTYWRDRSVSPTLHTRLVDDRPYDLVDAQGLCDLTAAGAFVLDVRPDSLLAPGRISEQTIAAGTLLQGVRIPLGVLAKRVDEVPKDRPIVIIDAEGGDAARAALILAATGRDRLHVLFDGLDVVQMGKAAGIPCEDGLLQRPVPYRILSLYDLDPALVSNGTYRIIDVRPELEFKARSAETWQNMGRLHGAINLHPDSMVQQTADARIAKHERILLMGRSNAPDVYAAARALCDAGYGNVSILTAGMWGVGWSAANLKGLAPWAALIERDPL